MKKNIYLLYSSLFIFLVSFSSCEAIKGIFKAGVWTGVIIVVAVIALIIYLVSRKSSK